MRVICPHCQTIYQLETTETDAVLVCHRCGTEFGMGEIPDDAQHVDAASISEAQTPDMFGEPSADEDTRDEHIPVEDEPDYPAAENALDEDSVVEATDIPAENVEPETQPEQDDEADKSTDFTPPQAEPDDFSDDHSDERSRTDEDHDADSIIIPAREAWMEDDPTAASQAEQTEAEQAYADDGTDTSLPSPPPPRAKLRIMPWLMAVVLLITGSGFWLNHDAWMDDPWLRSVLLNVGIGLEIRDKDWHINPDSVEATWLERGNKETVLVITGEVHNLLQTDLLPPLIHFTLFARDNPDELILERDLVITRPPLMQAIRQAPYLPPAHDTTPVAALGKRGFVLVLEDMPQNAGNFSLLAKAR